MRKSSISFAILLLLSACGGGGGDGGGEPVTPPAPTALAVTPANYQAVAQESVSSVSYLLDVSQFATGAQVASEGLLLSFARSQAGKLQHWFSSTPALVKGVDVAMTEPCSGGGSLKVTLDDRNGNQDIDVGESASLEAQQCVEAGASMNGRMGFTVNSLSGDPNTDVYTMAVTMTLTDLRASLSGGSITGNGTMGISVSSTGANTGSSSLTVDSLNVSGSFAGSNSSRALQNFRIDESHTPSGAGYLSSVRMSGTLSSSTWGSLSITLQTVDPFLSYSTSDYPHAGRITATGLNGSKVRITAQSETSTLVELDADGDNNYEASVVKPWSDYF
ncbi:MAG: hypothetical protein JNL87_16905 [Burkholderiaceae bacterium]|nr:hypothetical protein [Burkholderiaceae bacterium]